MKQILSGYSIVVAVSHDEFEYRNPKTVKIDYLYGDATNRICDIDILKCYANDKTFLTFTKKPK